VHSKSVFLDGEIGKEIAIFVHGFETLYSGEHAGKKILWHVIAGAAEEARDS